MNKWKKLGRIFNPQDYQTDWMKEYTQAHSTFIFDSFVRVY